MNKLFKILLIALGAILAVVAALAIALVLLFDPNQYKGAIAEAVKERTGRTLTFEGDLGWSLFPYLGIKVAGASLGNAPGFGEEPFVRLRTAGVRVELLPLLRGRIAVDSVHLEGLTLHLVRAASGQTNWDDLLARQPPAPPRPAEPAASEPAALPLAALTIQKLEVRNATLLWDDRAAGTRYALRGLDLRTGAIAAGVPVDLRLAFDLETGAPPRRTRVDLQARVALDVEGQVLEVPQLALRLDELALVARLTGRRLFDAPALHGTVEVTRFPPRTLMKNLGIEYMPADQAALGQFALKAAFRASSTGVSLSALDVRLDDSRLSGTLEIRDFTRPAYRFDLALDRIDLDRYFPAAEAAAGPGRRAGGEAATGGAVGPPVAIPLELLRALDVQGRLRIGDLKAMGLRASDLETRLSASGGRVRLGPSTAKLYGGHYRGETTLEVLGKLPALAFHEQLTRIQLGPFLKDAGLFARYSGTGDLDVRLTAQGHDALGVKQTLNGTVSVVLHDGKIEGVNLQKLIAEARALYDQARGKPVRVAPAAGDETAFKQLRASIRVTNGVARNDDLVLEGPVLRATGAGTADLVKETLDYRLNVTVAEGAERRGTTVPVLIRGSFAQPEYSVDFGDLLKQQIERKLEEKIEQKLERRLDRLLRPRQ